MAGSGYIKQSSSYVDMHALKVYSICSFYLLPHGWIHAQKCIKKKNEKNAYFLFCKLIYKSIFWSF